MTTPEASLDYLAWHLALGAVLSAREEIKANAHLGKPFAVTAEGWLINGEMRRQLFVRTRHFWCQRAGLDMTWFPLSEDAVVRLYQSVQLCTEPRLRAINDDVERADVLWRRARLQCAGAAQVAGAAATGG